MATVREQKKKPKPASTPASHLLVIWVSLKTIAKCLLHYSACLWKHNPLKVISQRQRRLYFVENYGEVMIKPKLTERILDLFLTDYRRRQRLLHWVHCKIRLPEVTDFSTSWQDGIALCAILESICPGVCPSYHLLSHLNRVKNCRLGLKLANKYLYVPMDLISPEEMAIAGKPSEHKIIQYISMLKWASENIKEKWSSLHESLIAAKSGRCFAKGSGLRNGIVGKRSKFTIIVSDTIGVFNMLVEIRGPNHEYCGERLVSLHQAKGVLDKSFDINSTYSDTIKYLEDGVGNTFIRKKVPPRYALDSGDLIHMDIQCGDEGTFYVTFVPRRAGIHAVAVKWQNHHVENSPFRIKVFKATNVSTKSLKGAQEKRVIYDSLSFTTYTGSSQDSLDNLDTREDVPTMEGEEKEGRSGTAIAKSKAYCKGRQLTVTRRRVLRRIITRNGEDIVIEEAISPSLSRQSSITDNSDEDNRIQRKEKEDHKVPSQSHPATPMLGTVLEERSNSKDKDKGWKGSPDKIAKSDIIVVKGHENASINLELDDEAPMRDDVIGSADGIIMKVEDNYNTVKNNNTGACYTLGVPKKRPLTRANVIRHQKTPARRTTSDGPVFQMRREALGTSLMSDTGSEVSSDDKTTDEDSGLQMKLLHSSSLKKSCMYISHKAFNQTISSMGDEDTKAIENGQVNISAKTKLRATQSLPIMRKMWQTDARKTQASGDELMDIVHDTFEKSIEGNSSNHTFTDESRSGLDDLENIITLDKDGKINMDKCIPNDSIVRSAQTKCQSEIHNEMCTVHDRIKDRGSDIEAFVQDKLKGQTEQSVTEYTEQKYLDNRIAVQNTSVVEHRAPKYLDNRIAVQITPVAEFTDPTYLDNRIAVQNAPVTEHTAPKNLDNRRAVQNITVAEFTDPKYLDNRIAVQNAPVTEHTTPKYLDNRRAVQNITVAEFTDPKYLDNRIAVQNAPVTEHTAPKYLDNRIAVQNAQQSGYQDTSGKVNKDSSESFEDAIKMLESLVYPKDVTTQTAVKNDKSQSKQRGNLRRQWTVFNQRSSGESSSDNEIRRSRKCKGIDSSISVDSANVINFDMKHAFQSINMQLMHDKRDSRSGFCIVMPKPKVDKTTQVSEKEIITETGWDVIEGFYLLLKRVSIKVPCESTINFNACIIPDTNNEISDKNNEKEVSATENAKGMEGVVEDIKDDDTVALDSPDDNHHDPNMLSPGDMASHYRLSAWLEEHGMTLPDIDHLAPVRQVTIETVDSGFDDNPSFNRQARHSLPSLRTINGHVRLHRRPYRGQILLDRKLVVSSSQSVSLERPEQGHEADDELLPNADGKHQTRHLRRKHRQRYRQESFSMSDSEISQRHSTNKRRMFQNKRCLVKSPANENRAAKTDKQSGSNDKSSDSQKTLKSRKSGKRQQHSDPSCVSTDIEKDETVEQTCEPQSKSYRMDIKADHPPSVWRNRSSTRSKSSSIDSNYNGFGISKHGRDDLLAQIDTFQSLYPTEESPSEDVFTFDNHGIIRSGYNEDVEQIPQSYEDIFSVEDDLNKYITVVKDPDANVQELLWNGVVSDSTCETEDHTDVGYTPETGRSVLESDSASDEMNNESKITDNVFDMFSSFDHSHLNDVLPRQESINLLEGYEDNPEEVKVESRDDHRTVVKVAGVGHKFGHVGSSNSFQVWIENPTVGSLSVNVIGPRPHTVTETSVIYTGDNLYEVSYGVTQPGFYRIYIRWGKSEMPECPYICEVTL